MRRPLRRRRQDHPRPHRSPRVLRCHARVGIRSNSPKGSLMSTPLDSAARERYERELAAAPTRPEPPTTVSSVPIDALYTADSLDGFDPDADLGLPGQYPFTR